MLDVAETHPQQQQGIVLELQPIHPLTGLASGANESSSRAGTPHLRPCVSFLQQRPRAKSRTYGTTLEIISIASEKRMIS